MSIRAQFKKFLSRHFLLVEFCHQCGQRQPIVWHAPDGIWLSHNNNHEILCPQCLSENALQEGVILYWTVGHSFPYVVASSANDGSRA